MSNAIPVPQEVLNLVQHGEPAFLKEEVCQTILAELVPDREDPQTEEIQQYLGFTGDPGRIKDVEAFLLSSLQAHRILFHHRSNVLELYSVPDQRLSNSLTHIFLVLNKPPRSFPTQDVLAFASNVNQACKLVKHILASNAFRLQQLLTSTDRAVILSPPRRELVEGILKKMQKEHTTRIELLLTRLHVTMVSFSRSERASMNPQQFSVLSRKFEKLQRKWAVPEPITIYQSLFAHDFILADVHQRKRVMMERLLDPMKQFVMGSVPDRGGRIFNQTEMPNFQRRSQGSTSHQGHRQRKNRLESFGEKRRSRRR